MPRVNFPEQILTKAILVPVGRVHVGLYFKCKPGKRFFIGGYLTGNGSPGFRMGGQFHKGIQHFPDTEIVDGAAEKNRRLTAF